MEYVLTMASRVTCTHEGVVTKSSSAKLLVNEEPVLVESSINNALIVGCTTVPDPNKVDKPCLQVVSIAAGSACTKLTVENQPVLLASLEGKTDGLVVNEPQHLAKSSTVQSKLKAV